MYDPIQVEVWRHLLGAIAEEMGAILERTAYSPNIKERRDFSCALFSATGELLAQAAHIPVHLGAMPLMMETLRRTCSWRPGSMWLCNDPAHGGTHLPDLTLVAPVFRSGSRGATADLLGFVANRAHHADVGGIAPGSMPVSREIFHEGLVLPPVPLVYGGRLRSDIAALVAANSRTPEERRGDLAAQVAANRRGAIRLRQLAEERSPAEFERRNTEMNAYAEALVAGTLLEAGEGCYRAEDWIEEDGFGHRALAIRLAVTIREGDIFFDFTGTVPEVEGPVNATEAVTRSACYYVARCLSRTPIPECAGSLRPIRVVAPKGTLVNGGRRAAVAAGNVETSQRIVDVALQALYRAFPDRIPASSQGTMNNLTIGGIDPRTGLAFAYYETIAGGAGAGPSGPGASAVHTHMTNTANTPAEALEQHYPLRLRRAALRDGSGGGGTHRGGAGVVRELELLAPATVSVISERRVLGPPGLKGGQSGQPGRNTTADSSGEAIERPGKFTIDLLAGSRVRIETPGGGGWGA